MDLLERYLQAVRWWLPKGADQDLVTELADDLRSQIEEKEVELARKLTDDELIAILKRCGHPMTVAGRLLPGTSFLEPTLSVVYGFVVRVVLLGVLPVALLLTALPALVAGRDPVGVLFDRLGSLVQAELYAFAVITLVFYLVNRRQSRLGPAREWDPRRLPRLRDTRRIPRSNSAAEVVVGLLFLAWWNGSASGPFHLGRLGDRPAWGAAWENVHDRLFWPVLVLSAAGVALSAVALFRPYWTRARLATRAAIDGALALTLALVLRPEWADLGRLRDYLRAGRHALRTAEAEPAVARLGIVWTLAVVMATVVIATVVDLVRLLRWKGDGAGGAPASRS